MGAATGNRPGSELLYGTAKARLALSGAQPEKVFPVHRVGMGVPETALKGQ